MESETLEGNSGMLSGKNQGGVQIGAGRTTLLPTVICCYVAKKSCVVGEPQSPKKKYCHQPQLIVDTVNKIF